MRGRFTLTGLRTSGRCSSGHSKAHTSPSSRFIFSAYIDEQIFRFNNRATKDNPLNDSDRFVAALAQVAGKRITYKELTGKTEADDA